MTDTYVTGHEQCPRCFKEGRDKSGDNLARYSDGSCYCFACGYTELSDMMKAERGLNKWKWNEQEEKKLSKERITQAQVEEIKKSTVTTGFEHRGIRDDIYAEYRVRFAVEENKVKKSYYPYTENGTASGYKIRLHNPKDFSAIGRVGKPVDLFGMWKWKTGAKTLVIAAGEEDAMAAYQMLDDYRKSKNSTFETTPCVSSSIGESGSAKQFAIHYDWLNQFEKIIYFPDNDDAGQEAIEDIVMALPKGKLFIGKLPEKDVNEMLKRGKEKQFISAFFDAKPYTPTGVKGSSSLFDEMVSAAYVEKLEFPSFTPKLNSMLAGGMALRTIGVISAFTGIAKSTFVNECCYYWLFNSPHKIAVVTMEQSSAQYGELILSRHMQVKIGKMLPEQKQQFYSQQSTVDAQKQLFYDEHGADRFLVIDDRDCEVESMKKAIERAVISGGAKIIVWDTISDTMDSLTVDEQAQLMKWIKSMVGMYEVSFILIAHQRKVPSGQKDGSQGAFGTESGVQGSSTITKSATWVLMAARDKTSEDPIEKNTTYLQLTKNRDCSETGDAGAVYYDMQTHTLHDRDTWLNENM